MPTLLKGSVMVVYKILGGHARRWHVGTYMQTCRGGVAVPMLPEVVDTRPWGVHLSSSRNMITTGQISVFFLCRIGRFSCPVVCPFQYFLRTFIKGMAGMLGTFYQETHITFPVERGLDANRLSMTVERGLQEIKTPLSIK